MYFAALSRLSGQQTLLSPILIVSSLTCSFSRSIVFIVPKIIPMITCDRPPARWSPSHIWRTAVSSVWSSPSHWTLDFCRCVSLSPSHRTNKTPYLRFLLGRGIYNEPYMLYKIKLCQRHNDSGVLGWRRDERPSATIDRRKNIRLLFYQNLLWLPTAVGLLHVDKTCKIGICTYRQNENDLL